MPMPYDATTKGLLGARPGDWLPFLGFPASPSVRLIDAELSTVTAAADKVLRVGGRHPWLLHLELQASRDPGLLERVLLYNGLLGYRHTLPVASVVVLLRDSADAPELTGVVERRLRTGERYLEFHYRVVRVWQMPVEAVLEGPAGVLPLAPLADVRQERMPAVVRRMEERLAGESPEQAALLWTATYILMGLRYTREFTGRLLRGVRAMRESVTWQAIFEEGEAKGIEEGKAMGEAEGIRKTLRLLGARKFGSPDPATETALAAITDPSELQALGVRLLDVESWQELIPAAPKRRRGRRPSAS
jgi:hypothetical protein